MNGKRKPHHKAAASAERPLRLVRDGEWLHRAACADEDTALFYDHDRETNEGRLLRVTTAKAICEGCPVRRECLNTALANDEPYGIWGGYTAPERWSLKRITGTA